MNYKNRAINAYKSVSGKKNDNKIHNDKIHNDKTARPGITKVQEERTGFLKLTKEKADYTKIAKFLLLLGKEEAVKVVKHLSPEEVEKISREISHTKRVDRVEAEVLLKEFGFDSEREAVRVRGGADAAAEILTRAFGKEESDRLLRKAVPDAVPGPFSFLNDLEFDQLILLLKEESTQVIALVLRYLNPTLSSKVINAIDKTLSTSIIKRIAKGGSVSTEVITGMEDSLKEKIRNQGKVDSEVIDGPSALAGILKFMNIEDEQKILDSLSEEDADMGKNIKERLFTIDTVLHIDRNDLQKILNEMSEKEIVLVLKAVDDDVKKKIRSSISTGRLILIDEEDDILGPVKKSEAELQLKDFLKLLRKREEEGAFIIIREEDQLI
jgi:flagellar motor switch protein FliG